MTAYDVRCVLEPYGWNSSAAIGGLATMEGMNRKDAEESDGKMTEDYLENMRCRLGRLSIGQRALEVPA